MAAPLLSARASASNWLTVWVARMLERPIWRRDCLRSSALVPSRWARSACMRRPASGVLSWCAASARKRFWVAIESFRRSSRSFTEDTSGATSSGTACDVQRAEVVGLAGADALFQLVQRLDGLHQRQPHQQHGQRQDDKLRQHHALDDFGGQHRALFQGLGHLDQGRPGVRQAQPTHM